MILEASLSGIFRILLWIFVISLLLRIIARLAAPYIVRRTEDMMRQRMNDMQQQFQSQQQRNRPEGEITVEQNRSRSGKQDGEYVDFVEIKD